MQLGGRRTGRTVRWELKDQQIYNNSNSKVIKVEIEHVEVCKVEIEHAEVCRPS